MRLKDCPEEWLECMAHGHAPKRESQPSHITYRPSWGTRTYYLECQRCGGWRVVAMDSLNRITLSRYFPAAGYLDARREFMGGSNDRASLRGEMWRRERAERVVSLPARRAAKRRRTA